jgi:hypothetical protein
VLPVEDIWDYLILAHSTKPSESSDILPMVISIEDVFGEAGPKKGMLPSPWNNAIGNAAKFLN